MISRYDSEEKHEVCPEVPIPMSSWHFSHEHWGRLYSTETSASFLTLKPSEIRSWTLEEKGYLNTDIVLGESQQESELFS